MRRTLALVASLLLFVSACGKDSTGPGGDGTTLTNGTFSGSVNGTTYVPITVLMFSTSGFTILSSANATGQSFAFGVQAAAPGQYAISANVANNAFYSEGTQGAEWVAGPGVTGSSGTVNFTTLTATHWVGSYTFVLVADVSSGATGTKTLTGTFNITN